MKLVIDVLEAKPQRRVEVVERKGIGHPDTLCDAMAERICVRLCQFYDQKYGIILHHNVDKILLCGGSSRPAFRGGELIDPIDIYIAGRVTKEWCGTSIPAEEIAVDACREVLSETLPGLNVDQNVRVIPRFRSGSHDLTGLFGRNGSVPLANDTSCGAGFAPLTPLESLVLGVERRLNAPETKVLHPEFGTDIKVMGVRIDSQITLTVGCAFIGRHVASIEDYLSKKAALVQMINTMAEEITGQQVQTMVNAADNAERGEIYLTVSGTSAEAGDDGQVGRGNRASGLITPYRVMTLEAVAGKNPVSHVGKIYNVLAERIARCLVSSVPGVRDASCVLVSQIGHAIDDPELSHVEVAVDSTKEIEVKWVEDAVRAELSKTIELREAFLRGQIGLY